MVLRQLTNGFLGLTNSRKGVMCLILFFCSLAPMTYLCFHGKLDSTAYAACMSALTVAVTAIFCHTQGKIDQINMNQRDPMNPMSPMNPMGAINPISPIMPMGTMMPEGVPLGSTISTAISTVETVIGSGPPTNLPGKPL